MRCSKSLILAVSMAMASPLVLAVPSEPMSEAAGGEGANDANQQAAQAAYNEALTLLEAADKLEAKAIKARKRPLSVEEVSDTYMRAREKFQEATTYMPNMAEAWNGVGYTQRKLGQYAAALAAYDYAIGLKPGYPEAIEYRGEAYLRMGRTEDAKQAYLDLFAGNRILADQLLATMKDWVKAQRKKLEGVEKSAVEDVDAFVQERAKIAAQTASLTREGAAASWK